MEHKFKYGDAFGKGYEVKLTNKRKCVEIKQITSKKPLYDWDKEEIIVNLVNSVRRAGSYEPFFTKYTHQQSHSYINEKIEDLEKRLEKLKFIRAIIGKEIVFTNPEEYKKEV